MSKKIYGDHSNHKWVTNSICRHLLYEGCDLMGKLGIVGTVHRKHLKNIDFNNPDVRNKAIEIMFELYDYLSDEVEVFPMFGTLLGIVRGDDLIPHDDDVDFGYFMRDSGKLIKKLDALHGEKGYLIVRNEFSNLYTLVKDGIMIDLYEYEIVKEDGILQQGHRSFYNLKYDEVFHTSEEALREITFRGRTMKCIAHPVRFFERYYGLDWKTPK